ncbi:hypothetical protein N9J26_01405 [bacterium]|nr:hypothetical protein [bacterium]
MPAQYTTSALSIIFGGFSFKNCTSSLCEILNTNRKLSAMGTKYPDDEEALSSSIAPWQEHLNNTRWFMR